MTFPELTLAAAGFQFLCFVCLVVFYCREASRSTKLSKSVTSLEQQLNTQADLLNSILDSWAAKFDPIELQTNVNSNLIKDTTTTKEFHSKLQVLHRILDSLVDFVGANHSVPKETFAHWKHRLRTLIRGQSVASLDLMPNGILDGNLLPCTGSVCSPGLQAHVGTNQLPSDSASPSPTSSPLSQTAVSALPPEPSRPDPTFWPTEIPELIPPPSSTPSPASSLSGTDSTRGSRRRRRPRRRAFDPRGASNTDLQSFSPPTPDGQRPPDPPPRSHYDPTAPLRTRTITDPSGDTAAVVTLPFTHPAGHYCATAPSALPGTIAPEKKTLYIPRPQPLS